MRKTKHPLRFLRDAAFWKRAAKVAAAIMLLPYLLTPLYLAVTPVSMPMLADMLFLKPVKRDWVPLGRISTHLIAAVVSSEDDAFCDHYGMDFQQMEKSIRQASNRGRPVRATSTITMQTAKNLFLWNGRSYIRKILEVPLTFWIELFWSKRRILEVYLNIAQWGDGIYGAEAAARYHFGIPARQLTPGQAALLASALPNPIRRNASRPGHGQMLIASVIQRRVMRAGPDLRCVLNN